MTQLLYNLYTARKPTIAQVHGAVRGGGVGLLAACDIGIGTADTTFRLSEVRIGMIPAMITPYLVASMGERQTKRYCCLASNSTLLRLNGLVSCIS